MKFLIIICLFGINSWAKNCLTKDLSHDVHFLNGIMVADENESLEKTDTSEELNGAKLLAANFNLRLVKKLYNPTQSLVLDIKEVMFQKNAEDLLSLYDDPDKRKEVLKRFIDGTTSGEVSKRLLKLLSKDKPNIIFAHSQGNLYANELCELKDDQEIRILAIAPPVASLKCNPTNTYALFDNDRVINRLRSLGSDNFFIKAIDSKINYSSYSTIISPNINNSISPFSLNHYLKDYLSHKEAFNIIKEGLTQNIDELYSRDYDFPLLTIKMKDLNVIDKTSDYLAIHKIKTDLWVRQNKADWNLMTYITAIFNSNFVSSLMSLNLSGINAKNFSKVIDTPIPVESDEEYADFLASFTMKLRSSCTKLFQKTEINSLCQKIKELSYFSVNEKLIKPLITISQNKDQEKFSLSCKDAEVKDYDLSIKYSGYLPRIDINDQNYNFDSKYSNKVKRISLGKVSIKAESGKFTVVSNIQYPKINQANDWEYQQCNTLRKLGTSSCISYFKKLEKEFFN